jgi:hypothetical protein
VVVDANVFPRTRWLRQLIAASRAGSLELVWSPLIIAESNRLLTWLWLERRGGDLSDASWRRCSADAKRMFAHLTAVFRVVDDRPPAAELWTPAPADAWDVPIWTAALRAEADVILSANLADGPPPDERGVQAFAGVDFLEPERFLEILDSFTDQIEAERLPMLEGAAPERNPYAQLYPDLWERLTRSGSSEPESEA